VAGSLQPRVKVWVDDEDVTYSDLNAEFDNVLAAMRPSLMDDYSANTAEMQVTTDPGEVGTESLATTLAGEIARIRFIIAEITGENEWYESPISSLTGLANAIGTGLTDNRLVSGRVRTTSQMPVFLVPNGAARTVKVDGTPVNFIYYIDGVEYTISTDVTITNLTAAPSSNNTALINDAVAADQYWTKYAGEDGSEITIDTAGTEITALIGKFAAFKLANGAADEYFTAFVSSATSLTKARRGYFFDSADAPVPRVVYSNNDTITLMKLTWVFAKTDGTLTATYNNPVWSDDEPSSPSIGDYWFDYSANIWKVYGVGSYSAAAAMLVGICIQDTTNTVAARSFEFFKGFEELNTVEVFAESNAQAKARWPGSAINVWGEPFNNGHNLHTWDMTLDLDSGVTEAASTYYYFYLTETGDKVISDVKPHDRREDLRGYYHPSHSWRCVGYAFNNGSSNLTEVESYYHRKEDTLAVRAVAATDILLGRDRVISLSGASFSEHLPPAALTKGQPYLFIHGGTSLTQIYTLDGFGAETIGGAATLILHTNGQSVRIMSDGTNYLILDSKTNSLWVNGGALTITGSGGNPTKGTGTTTDTFYWRRVGRNAEFRYTYNHSIAGVAGTGDYSVAFPTGLVVDTSVLKVNTTVYGTTLPTPGQDTVGTGYSAVTGVTSNAAIVYIATSGTFKVALVGGGVWSATANGLGNALSLVHVIGSVPIANWID
jgi:hypothetical protein